ncbi:MAG: bifunctional UDP-N-acetylmuramoyl-tripeptide:D-alanyl-D-alanine ligase/alanine racemase [Bacteroidaceae bacterium]|nr:bifunctional UDP-N-acetylmuramoyl-tripeptide:D-alanyl-D-alanine ligase/alanine racemase [Bacteroidaceae bacterium]
MKYELRDIAAVVGAKTEGLKGREIDWLLTDSRSLCYPESTLFFAIKTDRGNGHHYIADLYQRGVRAFVVSEKAEGYFPDADFLLVPDTLQALQTLAAYHRSRFDIPVIGITGSNGKTLVKEWLYQLLAPDFTVTRSPRSYNSQIGVPLSVWGLWEKTEVALFEAAISQRNEMAALERIIKPTIGIFTCLGSAHQENFTSMEEKCMEKLLLMKDAQVIIYPSGDETIENCIRQAGLKGKLIACPSTGNAFEDNKALCRAVCREMKLDEDVIEERVRALEPVAMRLEVKDGLHDCTLINDSYNSDLSSLDIALDFMNRRPEKEGRERTLILSDILQSGVEPHALYSQLADLLVSRGINNLLAVGGIISAHIDCFANIHGYRRFFPNTEALLASEALATLKHQLILIKGARSFHFERITDRLEKKVHETILEVNLSAIVKNLNYYRSFMKPETKMVCMVKADGYGAGAVEVAKTLQEHNVDYLAVAVADEGVTLREKGITQGIMIMNPEMSSFSTLFQYHLEPEIYSFRLLDALIHAAEHEGITNFPVHIKLDTGMRRLGFDPEKDMPQLIERLQRQTALIPRSVFSHFVGSDSEGFDDFSERQYELFLDGSSKLQEAFPHPILRHICNSAGIERFPERHLEMVRLGLGLYGINSRNDETIHNVSTLRTTILQIHDVKAGESVGYSRRTILERDSRIATLPIGYADGLNRLLGNRKGYCLVHGMKAEYVGNICMDVCMIDVTDIPCEEGDLATIFGDQLSPSELASRCGTIPYEILTGIAPRVKRIYFEDK